MTNRQVKKLQKQQQMKAARKLSHQKHFKELRVNKAKDKYMKKTTQFSLLISLSYKARVIEKRKQMRMLTKKNYLYLKPPIINDKLSQSYDWSSDEE